MSEALIDVDEEALAIVARMLGTTTTRDTINTALRRMAAAEIERRTVAIERIRELVAEGALNMEVLGLPEEYEPPKDPR
ncbi:type II toxin-antitoxin system VapB family antitoxin [Embleya sp. NBC_00888]|uniref:type II toxin-antitoxin system VapB family antitoxin n=1 Tax=Embleya sp. NBC_00888 TaxID=2975960 RepID=UPI00386C22DC|nr:type II toxin-antitoxin system VapB family antitoxin [Embleya sp. NBC_00888]